MISKEAEMANETLAEVAQKDILTANGALVKPRSLVRHISNVVSTNVGLYEIRINLLLWRLFKMSKQKESQPAVDSRMSEELVN